MEGRAEQNGKRVRETVGVVRPIGDLGLVRAPRGRAEWFRKGSGARRPSLNAMTVLFGGDACPLGVSLQFLEAPEAEVVAALPGSLAGGRSTSTGSTFPQALSALLPFQAPWTRMLTAQVGRWTALANNGINGGDGTAPGPAVSRALGVRCVVATHAPRYGPGHAQTQLEVIGPGGEPPLMYIRSISATATDGRWEWHESGSLSRSRIRSATARASSGTDSIARCC